MSDGTRIYFNEGQTGSVKIAQASVTGGRTGLIDTRLVNSVIVGLAPDASALLALVGGTPDPAYALWSIPLPVGEPRRLSNIEMGDAAFFPDGRILLQIGTDLYVADKDASNPRKLISLGADSSATPAFRRTESELFSRCTVLVEVTHWFRSMLLMEVPGRY